jgi:hypothetical protein
MKGARARAALRPTVPESPPSRAVQPVQVPPNRGGYQQQPQYGGGYGNQPQPSGYYGNVGYQPQPQPNASYYGQPPGQQPRPNYQQPQPNYQQPQPNYHQPQPNYQPQPDYQQQPDYGQQSAPNTKFTLEEIIAVVDKRLIALEQFMQRFDELERAIAPESIAMFNQVMAEMNAGEPEEQQQPQP